MWYMNTVVRRIFVWYAAIGSGGMYDIWYEITLPYSSIPQFIHLDNSAGFLVCRLVLLVRLLLARAGARRVTSSRHPLH